MYCKWVCSTFDLISFMYVIRLVSDVQIEFESCLCNEEARRVLRLSRAVGCM